jgi:hypothetical protein
VGLPIVQIVCMAFVLNRGMPALRVVLVAGVCDGLVHALRHGNNLFCEARVRDALVPRGNPSA